MDICDVMLAQLYSELQPPNAEPMSIEVLAGSLEKHCRGCRVSLITINPLTHFNTLQELITQISASGCKLLGLSVPQGTYGLAMEVLSALESAFSSSKRPLVVLGHALPTYMPEAFLDLYPWAIVAKGWGEDALVGLTLMLQSADLCLEDVPGIIYKNHNEMVSTPLKNQIIPSPPKRIKPEKYFARLETSRGCHYGKCTFCTRPPGPKDRWSRLPLEDLLDSVRELKDRSVYHFTFTDEDFIGNDLIGALKIAKGIAEIGQMSFSLSVRADNIFNPNESVEENSLRLEVLKALKLAGLSWVFIGAESLSDSQLRRYGKGIRVRNSIVAVEIVQSLGIQFEFGFILFDPFVLLQELQQTALVLRNSGTWRNVSNIFSLLRVQKDTPYEYLLKRKGLIKNFDVNLLSYDWEFQEEPSSYVAKVCMAWSDAFDQLRRLLRNLERTNREHPIAEKFMKAFRELDLLVFENVLNFFKEDALLQRRPLFIENAFYNKRRSLVTELEYTIQSQVKGDEDELLLDAIDKFLSLKSENEHY